MLILTLRTDKPESEIAFFEGNKQLSADTWQAHRQLAETIHKRMAKNLQSIGKDWQDIGGIAVFQGPGSYTGLRIGISVANALAYSLDIPIVAANGKDWQNAGIERLAKGQTDGQALPEYGAPAFVTRPKK